MKLRALLPFLSLPLLATASPAFAQEAPSTSLPAVVFPTMAPDGSSTQLGAQIGIQTIEDADDTLQRVDLMGQFVTDQGYGGYASIAASFGEDVSHLGSLEVGGLMRHRSRDFDLGLRAGLVLPTSGSDDDFGDGAFTHLLSTLFARPSDLAAASPDATILRLSITPSTRHGNFVARADIGLDVVLDSDGDSGDPVGHVDVGAGFHNGKLGVLGELSTVFSLEEGDPLYLGALTGQIEAGMATPYITISKPFGDVYDDFFGEELDVMNFTVGVRGRL